MDSAVELLLREYERDKLFGSVEIKYESGRVVLIKKSETIKPACRDNRGEGDDEHE